jgi:hypothetical protein
MILAAVLRQAQYRLEGLYPRPLDLRCICGADISQTFKCFSRRMVFENHDLLSLRRRSIGCPICGKTSYASRAGSAAGFVAGA